MRDGEARILREARVGGGELAEEEDGAAGRFDAARVLACRAKAGDGLLLRSLSRRFHGIALPMVTGSRLDRPPVQIQMPWALQSESRRFRDRFRFFQS